MEARELGFRVLLRSSCRVWDSFRVQGLGFKLLKASLFLIACASVKFEFRAWDNAGFTVSGFRVLGTPVVPFYPFWVWGSHI